MCRAAGDPSGPAYQCKDKQSVAAAAHQEVMAYIGATAYRTGQDTFLGLETRAAYFRTHEWQEFDDHIYVSAAVRGLEVHDAKRADGLWEGEAEPSGAYQVTGTRPAVMEWAGHVAARYGQDAVMVVFADAHGAGRLYTYETGPAQAGEVMGVLQAAGLPGGTLADGRLQIVSEGALPAASQTVLAMRYRSPAVAAVQVHFVAANGVDHAHAPIREIQLVRQRYAEQCGLTDRGPLPHLTEVDDIAAATAYAQMVHTPQDRTVQRSYQALREHVVAQHEQLMAAGYRFEPWHGGGEQPYRSSAQMMADLRENKHLFYFRTEVSDTTEGALAPGHPMAKPVQITGAHGRDRSVPLNDVFRCVHDAIGHGDGVQFGPVGEKRAWWAHRSCLPRAAHLALWNETRGQACWTNAGPHLQTTEGTALKHAGDEGWLPLSDRPYPVQKAGRVPKGLT